MNFITINKISGLFRQTILNFGHIALLLIANFPLILNSNSPSLYTIAEITNNKKKCVNSLKTRQANQNFKQRN